jgi:hypothetical protein
MVELFGCSQLNQQEGLLDDIEETSLLKTDDFDSINVVLTEEVLYSETLKSKLCTAIRLYEYFPDHFVENCMEIFYFTVTEAGKSTQYAYLDNFNPITMRLRVLVENPENQKIWNVILNRKLSDDFHLTWDAVVDSGSEFNPNQYIQEIAEKADCDWIHFGNNPQADPVDYQDLPLLIQEAVDTAITSGELFSDQPGGLIESSVDNDCHAEIVKDGEVVGYIVDVLYYYVGNDQVYSGDLLLYFNIYGVLVATYNESWIG